MARSSRRNRNRNHRWKRNRRLHQFDEYANGRFMETILEGEQHVAHQREYQGTVKNLEDDLLARTVFVANVRDVKDSDNLLKLKTFMEQKYGPVERCMKASFFGGNNGRRGNHYPPARVRFYDRRDAERIFRGMALVDFADAPVVVPCPSVGMYRYGGGPGAIRIRPALRYPGMTDDKLKGGCIRMELARFSLGHWVPTSRDSYLEFAATRDNDDEEEEEQEEDVASSFLAGIQHDEFVEEESILSDLSMEIDMQKRRVHIVARKQHGNSILDLFAGLALSAQDPGNDASAIQACSIISFRFKELRDHINLYIDKDGAYYLLFALKWPPCLYNVVTIRDREIRKRCVDFEGVSGSVFGRCLGFSAKLKCNGERYLLHHEALVRLKKSGVFSPDLDASGQARLIETVVPSNIDAEYTTLQKDLSTLHSRNQEIGFLLKGLIDNGKCSWWDMAKEASVLAHLQHMSLPKLIAEEYAKEENVPTVVQTLGRMLVSDTSIVTRFPCMLFVLLASAEVVDYDKDNGISIPDHCTRVPRLLLTPCQERFIDIGVEMSNRVLRKFTCDHGFHPFYFLRVQIANESGKPFFADDLTDAVESRILSKLLGGIEVNGRKYVFLAYSSSQLKESSVWMVYTTDSQTWPVYRIRSALGDFSTCTTSSKWAARIGQCFSTTVDCSIGNMKLQKPTVINDIHALNGKDHSDGTGVISRELMNELVSRMPYPPANLGDVSIVQIRFGGAKGTLSSWTLDASILACLKLCQRTANVILRKSMTKFESNYESIEVCALGTTIPYYLNRNVILLLRAHHVREQIFLDMQRKMLDDLDKMLEDCEKAAYMLPRLSGPDSATTATLLSMLHTGLKPQEEPFMYSCLQAIRTHHLFTLRKKARVFVEKGAVLMGGMDETGLLAEGCVHVNVNKLSTGTGGTTSSHKVLLGPVMVTKHPAMHPGDVRMLLAVDIPALRDHTNVILFSQKGTRPEADKMSGSDLDGDQFAVTWDSRLFLKEWNEWENGSPTMVATVAALEASNHPPMEYDAPATTNSAAMPSDTSQHDNALVQHFVNHVKNDNLGRIATLWQDFASQHGADCRQCVRLAEAHSIAVDFPKSGVPATIPDDLKTLGFNIAHWREVKGKKSRHCDSVLGKMYDRVIQRDKKDRENKVDAQAGRKIDQYGLVLTTFEDGVVPGVDLQRVYRQLLVLMLGLEAFPESEQSHLHLLAQDNRQSYEDDIRAVMSKYKIRSEGELFTGCIRKYHKLNKKKQHSIAEDVRRQCGELRKKHQTVFWESVLDLLEGADADFMVESDEDDTTDDVQRVADIVCGPGTDARSFNNQDLHARRTAFALAAAYYKASYYFHPAKPIRGSALFSFPWIMADVIRAGIVEAQNGGGK